MIYIDKTMRLKMKSMLAQRWGATFVETGNFAEWMREQGKIEQQKYDRRRFAEK